MNKFESKYFSTAVKMDLALISLLKKKPLDYISVSEICRTAGVNRSTFYLHYETIGDLLEEAVRYLLDDFVSYFTDDINSISFDYINCEEEELFFANQKYLIPYLTYFKENKEVFVNALAYNKTFGFDKIYRRMFENIFNPILDRFHYPEEDRKYVMMYYLNGLNAIVTEWIKDGCGKAPEEIAKIMMVCIYGLERPAKS